METQSPSLEMIAKHPILFLGQLWLPTYTVELCNFKLFSLRNIIAEDQDPSVICSETSDRLNHDLPHGSDPEVNVRVENLILCPRPLHRQS